MSKNNPATTTAEEVTVEQINQQAFLQPFSDDRPWDAMLIRTEIMSLVQINTICVVEIGKRLVFAKNNVPQGRWLEFLESVNVPERTARRYMRAAQKMLAMPRLKQLEAAGISKLDEILRADDEDLADFEESGVFMGKTVDELQAMTREELKSLVREKDKRLDQAKEQYDVKDQEISSLRDKVEKLKGGPVEEEVFFKDLHHTRRSIMSELESYLRHVSESGNPVETIGVYNLLNQIRLNCNHLQRRLEDESPVGPVLLDSAAGYDSPFLQQTDLGEIANQEAADLDLINTGDDNSDGA